MAENVVIAGGDARDIWLARVLLDHGYNVQTWGCQFEDFPLFHEMETIPHMLIGPLTGIDPYGAVQTAEGIVHVTPKLLSQMGSGAILAAGLIDDVVKRWANTHHVRVVEYRSESSFMWLNAVPTAEGAIKAAIGRSGLTLYQRPLAILGFGRVGSILALRLQAYGAHVTVFERSRHKRAMAQAMGFPAFPLRSSLCPPIDGLFNTIPAPVIDEDWIHMSQSAWIIDLASKPGGILPTLRLHGDLKMRYESLLSIPGKVAPKRAAEIIWETLQMALQD